MTKFKVDVSAVRAAAKLFKDINEQELCDLEYNEAPLIPITDEDLKQWEYVGLSNIHFIKNHFKVRGNTA